MARLKIFIMVMTFIPILVLMIVAVPVALIGLIGKWGMDWSAKKANELSEEINDLSRSI